MEVTVVVGFDGGCDGLRWFSFYYLKLSALQHLGFQFGEHMWMGVCFGRQECWICDENHKAFKDPLHVPVGPITKARSKKIKEALNGLIQEIWADSNVEHSKFGPKEDEGVINLIQAIEG